MGKFKNFIARLLCLSFAVSLAAVPNSGAADEDFRFVDISGAFNQDLFVMEGNATRDAVYADLLYDGANIPAQNKVSIGDCEFEIQGNFAHDENDVIKVEEDVQIELNNEIIKTVAVIANGVSEGGTINAKIIYSDGSEEILSADIAGMTQKGPESFGMGVNLYKGGTRLRPVFEKGDTELYLNAAFFNLTKTLKAQSITFMPADFEYHIIAVTECLYNSDELAEMMEKEIEETLPLYQGKDIFDLNGEDIAPLESLMKALQTGKELGFESATDENIEFVSNLYNGYILYNEQKRAADEIEEIMSVKDYTEVTFDKLTDEDIENLGRLIEIYEKVDSAKLEELKNIWEYFELDETLYPEINLEDKEKIEKLEEEYKYYKEKTELEEKIKEYESLYLKSIDLIQESDLAKLEELLGFYEEAKAYEIEINENNKIKAETIINGYDSYKTSEDDIGVDISPYVNSDNILMAGDSYDPATLGGGVFSAYLYGTELEKSKGIMTNNELYASNEDKWVETGRSITYNLVENGWKGRVNDSITMSQACTEVRIPLSGRILQEINIAAYTVETTITPEIVYDDGTREVLKGASTKAYASAYGDQMKQNRAYITGNSDGILTYNESGQNGFFGVVGMRTFIKNDAGELVDNGSNQTLGFVSFAFKIPKHKKVKELILTGSDKSKYGVVGINEVPLKNADLREGLKNAWESINPDEVTSEDIETVKSIVQYVNEGKLRGIIFDDIVDMDIIKTFEEMVLTAEAEFSRVDKDTVLADISFSVPVKSVEGMIAVNDQDADAEFTYELSQDKTNVKIYINCSQNGGDIYSVTLSKDIAVEKYSSMTLGTDMVFSYNLPAFIDAKFENNILTVKNNSLTEQSVALYITKTNDEKTFVRESVKEEKVLEGGKELTLSMYVGDAEGYETFVWNNNMKPLAETEPAKVTPEEITAASDYKEIDLNLDSNKVVISGKTPGMGGGKNVTLRLSGTDKDYYIGNVKTNSAGVFRFEISLNEVDESGNINVYIGGDDFEKPDSFTFYFSSGDDRITLIENIKNAVSAKDIEDELEAAKKILALDFAPYNSITMSKFAERIYKIKDTFESDKPAEAQNILKVQSILQAFEEGIESAVAENGNLKYDEYMNYSDIDKVSTLWTIYNNDLSDEGKNFVVQSLLKSSYDTAEDVKDQLSEGILLAGIRYPKTSGTGYIARVLTKDNAVCAQLDSDDVKVIEDYEKAGDKTKYNEAIIKADIKTIADIIDCLNSADDKGTTGGSSSNPSSSNKNNGSGGGSSYYAGGKDITPEPEKNEEKPDKIFDDVDESFWAYEPIKNLYEKGIIAGKGDNKFAPSDNLTRAEFVKILCEAEGIASDETVDVFIDVEKDAWYAKYVSAAYNHGLITGISENEFGTNLPISRQDICTILYRLSGGKPSEESSFKDSGEIAEYAAEAVAFFSENGVVSGFSDNTFRPKSLCTRAQAAAIIYRFMNQF